MPTEETNLSIIQKMDVSEFSKFLCSIYADDDSTWFKFEKRWQKSKEFEYIDDIEEWLSKPYTGV